MVINWLVNGKSTLWGSFLGILFGGWGSLAQRAPWHSRSSIAVWKAEGCWRIEWQVLSSSFSNVYIYIPAQLCMETCLFKKVTTKRSKKFQKVSPNPPFRLRSYCLPTHQRAPANRHHAPDGGRASSDVETSKAAASVAESG